MVKHSKPKHTTLYAFIPQHQRCFTCIRIPAESAMAAAFVLTYKTVILGPILSQMNKGHIFTILGHWLTIW